MIRTAHRLLAGSLAILTALAAPGNAVAHGVAHRHLLEHHESAPPSPRSDHHEQHGHPHTPPHAHANADDPPHHHGQSVDIALESPHHPQYSQYSQYAHYPPYLQYLHGMRGSSAVSSERPPHAHQHPTVSGAVSARDTWRLVRNDAPAALASRAPTIRKAAPPVPPRIDRAQHARPAPETGPPPTPRAPPLS